VATRSCCMAWSAAGGSAHGTSPSPGLTTELSVGMAVSAERPQLPADPEDAGLQVWSKAKGYFNGKAIPRT
jgi:hypothetical protein